MPGAGSLRRGCCRGWLFGFVGFEEGSGLFEVEMVSVYDHLVFASVFRDVDDVLNSMALVSQGSDEKIDVYHALEFTGSRFYRHLTKRVPAAASSAVTAEGFE
jgi:hypothetical protein